MRCAIVFETQELQEHIFSYTDQQSLARCARVCKSWTDTCLDSLWFEINERPSFVHLLSVLGPMRKTKPYGVQADDDTFHEVLFTDSEHEPGQWERLMSYGQRVKRMILGAQHTYLHHETMQELALWRPALSLTPHLRTLHVALRVDADLDICFFFYHEGVENLTIVLDTTYWQKYVNKFRASIFRKSSSLRNFKLEAGSGSSHSISSLHALFEIALPFMTSLHTLSIPRSSLTPNLMKLIGKNQSLKKILANKSLVSDADALLAFDGFFDGLDRVITLEELEVCSRLSSTTALWVTNTFVPNLTSLHINFDALVERPKFLAKALKKISRYFPQIRKLSLDCKKHRGHVNSEQQEIINEEVPLTDKYLTTISSMLHLQHLDLSWATPIICTNEELVLVLSKIPQIEVLMLNAYPAFEEPSTPLDVNVLPLIARLCPSLQQLSLFIDCTIITSVYNPRPNTTLIDDGSSVFRNLKCLDLGLSPVFSDPLGLALRLNRILPPDCEFPQTEERKRRTGALAWKDIRVEVVECMSILAAGRREEQKKRDMRADALEKRITELELELQVARQAAASRT